MFVDDFVYVIKTSCLSMLPYAANYSQPENFANRWLNGEIEIFVNESVRLHNTKMASNPKHKLSNSLHGLCCTRCSADYATLLFKSLSKKANHITTHAYVTLT